MSEKMCEQTCERAGLFFDIMSNDIRGKTIDNANYR